MDKEESLKTPEQLNFLPSLDKSIKIIDLVQKMLCRERDLSLSQRIEAYMDIYGVDAETAIVALRNEDADGS